MRDDSTQSIEHLSDGEAEPLLALNLDCNKTRAAAAAVGCDKTSIKLHIESRGRGITRQKVASALVHIRVTDDVSTVVKRRSTDNL